MADYKINIEAILNMAKAKQELQNFLKEDHKVELKTDIDNKQSVNAGKRMGAEVQKGFSTNFNKAFSDMLSYKAANMSIDAMKKSVKAMVDEVTELDASLTEFNKVADLSASGLEDFTKNAYSQASEIGRTGREMVDASTEFKKAGYTIDQSLNLGKSALMMTNIGDGISDVSAASSSLIAVMKGFKMQDSEAMNILDMINEVSNTQPIGFDNLTDGLTRISGTMNRSGNSIQETIGMLTGGFSSLRNMSKVATGLNTISATLRGMDEDGNAVDGLTSKLDSAFKKIGVNIIDPANGQLRSTFDIMKDYASVYDTLTDNQKQYYAELAANKRQATVWDAMIQNWDTVTSSVTSATNSLGSATKENEIFRNSIKGMKNEFTNAFSTLAQETIDDEWIKNVIEGATNLLETLGNIAGQDTLIGDVISGATEGFKDLSSVLNSLSENDFLATAAQYFLAFKGLKTGAGLVKTMMGIGKEGALLSNIFGTGTEKAEEYGEAINNLSNLTITAGTSISGMKTSLTGGIKALTAFAKSNPITAVAAGVATAGLIGLQVYNRYKENMIEGATEASKAWNDKLTGLQDQMSQVQELRLKLNTEDLSDAEIIDIKSQILDIQSQITSAYGEQASGIDLVNGNLQTQLDLVNSISGGEAKKSINQNKAVYEDAKREMTKDDRSYMLGDVAQSIDAGGVSKDIYDIANDIEGITPDKNETGAYTIHFKGDVKQADESINDFMSRVDGLRGKYKTDQYATDVIDSVLGYSQTSLENVSDTLEKYQDNYNSYLQQSMFAKGTGKNSPAGIFNDYADAVKKYNDALMSGDSSQVYEARAAFNDVKTNVDGVLTNYPEYQQLFDDVGQQLDETASKSFDFQEAIQGTVNKDNIFSKSAKDVDKFGNELKKLNLDSADVVDALMTKGDQQGESYIQGLADVWGLKADATAEQIQAFADVLANARVVSNGTAEDIQGNDGIDGVDGKDGKSYYTWVKYANSATPTEMSDIPDGMDYIGIAYNKETRVESDDPNDYKWSLLRGKQGIQGIPGDKGEPLYTWIKYADTPTTGMSDTPEGKDYMGISYNNETIEESEDYSDYQWIYIRGSQGIPGKPGVDGKSSYLHIRYSNDGGVTFTDGNGETLGVWIGTYVDENLLDSDDISDYRWKKFVGEDGKDGIGYTIALSNENHGFVADGDGVVQAEQIQIKVCAWLGVEPIATTVTVPELPDGMTATVSNNGTDTTYITLNVDSTLTDTQGTVEFGVTADGVDFVKVFSWSVNRGGKDGKPGTVYGVDSSFTSVVYNIRNGECTPSSVSFNAYYSEGDSKEKLPLDCYMQISYTSTGSTWIKYGDRLHCTNGTTAFNFLSASHLDGLPVNTETGIITAVKCEIFTSATSETSYASKELAIIPSMNELAVLGFVEENNTIYVDGSNFYAGSIHTSALAAEVIKSVGCEYSPNSVYATKGTCFDLATGVLASRNFAITEDGEVYVKGHIIADSLTLGSGVMIDADDVSGLDNKVSYYVDESGAIIKGTPVGSSTASASTTSFKVSTSGLLEASNAIIYGTIYASAGSFTGTVDAKSMTAKDSYKIYVGSNGACDVITASYDWDYGYSFTFGNSSSSYIDVGWFNGGKFISLNTDKVLINAHTYMKGSLNLCGYSLEEPDPSDFYNFSCRNIRCYGDMKCSNSIYEGGTSLANKYATISQLSNYATTSQLSNYATTSYVSSNYATTSHGHFKLSLGGSGTDLVYAGTQNNGGGSYTFAPYSSAGNIDLGCNSTGNSSWYNIYTRKGVTNKSDRNDKENFATIDERYEKMFMDLSPSLYMLKGTNGHIPDRVHCGFIAQEVNEAAEKNGLSAETFAAICRDDLEEPTEDGRTETWGLRYHEFHGLEVHMIQKALRENEELKADNIKLKEEIEFLKERMSVLEGK